MKYVAPGLVMLSTVLLATSEVSTFSEIFSEAKTSGNVKYYYIQTDKDNTYLNKVDTSACMVLVLEQLS